MWQGLGAQRAYTYTAHNTAALVSALQGEWDVSSIQPLAPPDMFGAMAMVPLPLAMQTSSDSAEASRAAVLYQDLLHDCRVEVPVKRVHGTLWLRVSSHIYNEASIDCAGLSDAVSKLQLMLSQHR
jgi:isopenicillin-N epimerase